MYIVQVAFIDDWVGQQLNFAAPLAMYIADLQLPNSLANSLRYRIEKDASGAISNRFFQS